MAAHAAGAFYLGIFWVLLGWRRWVVRVRNVAWSA
jgi:hypothetical protein